MNALKRKSDFEDTVKEADHPRFRVKLPERYAKFIAESPALAVLDEGLEEQQRKVAEEQVK